MDLDKGADASELAIAPYSDDDALATGLL